MEFFMRMAKVPTVTHQMHRVTMVKGKPRFYDSDELKDARAKLTANLSQYSPAMPYNNGLQLCVKWCFPLAGKHRNGEYRTTKPDTDNLQKLLKDCMTAVGFWADDALVAREIVEKFWAEVPGIYINVEPLE